MRYLLDELMTYEEGFSDILMADRAPERHETFMGIPEASASVTRRDLKMFEANILQQIHKLLLSNPGMVFPKLHLPFII